MLGCQAEVLGATDLQGLWKELAGEVGAARQHRDRAQETVRSR